jgi:hypothetical protein
METLGADAIETLREEFFIDNDQVNSFHANSRQVKLKGFAHRFGAGILHSNDLIWTDPATSTSPSSR